MKQVTSTSTEKGQALAETAVFSLLAVLLAFGILALIPIHRVRTQATAAAYACTQFVSQSLDPARAVAQAEDVAQSSLEADWSGTLGAAYAVQAWSGGGGASGCSVHYRPPLLFNGLLGLNPPGWQTISFNTRTEAWKARWP